MRRIAAIIALVLIAVPCGAVAANVDACKSSAGLSCNNMTVTVCPRADYDFISRACAGVNDYIWIVAKDTYNNPIPGIPWTDYWLNACNPARQVYLCASPFAADSLTGPNGRTTFSGRIAGGGCNMEMNGATQGIWVAIQGKVVLGNKPNCDVNLCLDVRVKSPDLTGPAGPDGIVNQSDLSVFIIGYNKQPPATQFNSCCDFNDDGDTNLVDFALFRQHYGHRCW